MAFRKKLYHGRDELPADGEEGLEEYNQQRPHSGKCCFGKTPQQTFLDAKSLAREKMLDALPPARAGATEAQKASVA